MSQAKFDAFLDRMGAAVAIQGLDAIPVSSLRETLAFITDDIDGAPSQAELAGAGV